MPRSGGTYSLPSGTLATTATPIGSAAYNAFANDLVTDLNAARPITAGGTGATTAAAARTALGGTATGVAVFTAADAPAARVAIGAGQMAVVTRNTTQSIPNTTSTAISWNNAQINDGTIYDAGSPTRLTVPTGATRVRVTLSAYWAANSTGVRNLKITVNGSSDIVFDIRSAINETGAAISRVYSVTAGDYFEAFVNQNSGGALNLGGNNGTVFSLEVLL